MSNWSYRPPKEAQGKPRRQSEYTGKHPRLVRLADSLGNSGALWRHFILNIIALIAASYLVFYFSSKIGSVANVSILVTTFVALSAWLMLDSISMMLGDSE